MDQTPPPSRLGSLFGYALLGAAGVVAVVMALQLELWRGTTPGPGLFPFLASVAMIVLSAIGLVATFLRGRPAGPRPQIAIQGRLRVVIYVVSFLAYALLLEHLGFYVTTALVLAAILKLAERLPWRLILPVIAGTLIFTHFLFASWLGVYFPSGSVWEYFQ